MDLRNGSKRNWTGNNETEETKQVEKPGDWYQQNVEIE